MMGFKLTRCLLVGLGTGLFLSAQSPSYELGMKLGPGFSTVGTVKEQHSNLSLHLAMTGQFKLSGGSKLIGELDGIERLSQALLVLYFLGTIVPVVAVAVRRLHDTGRSGRTLLLALIPVIGPIILLVLYLSDGDAEMNDYGASPKYRWS